MRILITRPHQQAEEFAAELRSAGFQNLMLEPLLSIRPIEHVTLNLDDVKNLVITSQNAVFSLLKSSAPKDIKIFVVGVRTAEKLREAGYCNLYVGNHGGEDLYPLIQNHIKDRREKILHPAGLFMKESLQNLLKEGGYCYSALPVYRADPISTLRPTTEKALMDGEIDVITFFSPRTAEIFVKLTSSMTINRENVVVCCASNAIMQKISHLSWQSVLVAENPHGMSMIELLKTIKKGPSCQRLTNKTEN
ncbi:MAG: uroporphyrinogen-III synthase [Caedimonadaceae bacterium]|nr:MAG: uroporphyrinogen-III synthase [Caedimonadaceae bacterium]